VVIPPIDQRDAHRRASQRTRATQPREAATEDDDVWLGGVAHRAEFMPRR
jgi:hypothetical protein